jgi:hypothetical protein
LHVHGANDCSESGAALDPGYPPVGSTRFFNEFALFRKSANLACRKTDVRARTRG